MKSTKIFSLAFIFALIFIVALSLSVSAEDGDDAPKPVIVAKNVSYESSMRLLFAVDSGSVPADEIEMLFWNSEPESVYDKPDHVNTQSFSTETADGTVLPCVFHSEGIAAKDAPDSIYASAHVKNTDVYSDIVRYSLLEYVYERQSSDSITSVQERLYNSVIEYTESAQSALGHDVDNIPTTYRYISANGGLLSDGYDSGVYKIGSSLTVFADNYDGFSVWVDETGAIVSDSPEYSFTVGKEHKTYTAVSGCSINVIGGTQDNESGKYSVGEKATLRAPLSKTVDGVDYGFAGWEDSSGCLLYFSAVAEFAVLKSETYTATYQKMTEMGEVEDFDASSTPSVSSTPVKNTSASATMDSTSKVTKAGFNGKVLEYGSIKFGTGSKSYVNTPLGTANENTDVKVFGFKCFIGDQDLDFSDGITPGDGYSNKLNDFTVSKTETLLYTASLYIGDTEVAVIAIRAVVENGFVIGYNLTDMTGETVYNSEPLSLNSVYSIGIELIAYGENEACCNVYINGNRVAKTNASLEAAAGNATVVFGTTKYNKGYLYLDDIFFRELN